MEESRLKTKTIRAGSVVSNDDTYMDAAMRPVYEDLVATIDGDHPLVTTASKKSLRGAPKKSIDEGCVRTTEKHLTGVSNGETIFSKALG